MKIWRLAFLCSVVSALWSGVAAQSTVSAPAVFASAADLRNGLSRAPADQNVFTTSIQKAIAPNASFSVDVLRRLTNEEGGLIHERVTEIYQIIEGGGTLLTGGTLADPKQVPLTPAMTVGPTRQGSAIQGGQSRHVGAGDVVVIPAGVPHMFTAVDGSIAYLVIRVDPK
jgi:mannose-6-phosphate isomerase-like protein (cupin superfamily)